MSDAFEVAVLGGGPAGLAAAAKAARHGAATVLFDESATPGGHADRGAAGGATVRTGSLIWGLGGGPLQLPGMPPGPFRIDYLAAGQVGSVTASALILCPEAQERMVPFPGWTLPGVIGLAEATALLQAGAVLPGRRVVVAGTGPLLAKAAAGILRRGGQVAAVIDARPRREWHATRPARGAGVPVLSGWRVARALGEETLDGVEVVPLQGGPPRRFAADTLCVGHGRVPVTEASRLFGAAHRFAATRGGWHPQLDAWQRTSVSRLYAAGDSGGIADAAAAGAAGEIAALAAMQDLGRLSGADALAHAARPRRILVAARRVAAAMARLVTPPAALIDAIPADCTVCRCEDITRAGIEAAVQAGARDLNQVKQFTRCGMGPCQGRICGDTAAALLASATGRPRSEIAGFTPRLPLRPVPMRALLGDFDYAEIPVPAPAPI